MAPDPRPGPSPDPKRMAAESRGTVHGAIAWSLFSEPVQAVDGELATTIYECACSATETACLSRSPWVYPGGLLDFDEWTAVKRRSQQPLETGGVAE